MLFSGSGENVASRIYLFLLVFVVPGGGFEPPTRGFSVRCSTPELPGHSTAPLLIISQASQYLSKILIRSSAGTPTENMRPKASGL